MAQFHMLSNFYQINNLEVFHDLLKRLQEQSGNLMDGDRDHYEFNVAGTNDPKHLYELEFVENGEREKGINAKLGGKELVNDPMHGLRSAEDLMQSMISLRQFNARNNDAIPLGYSNFFQVYEPLSWLETAGSLREYGDIEKGDVLTIKTSPEGIEGGVYTLVKIIRDGQAGISVNLDGTPTYNYPKPMLRTAEQMVDVILTLKKKFAQGSVGAEFNFNPENPKPLLASVRTDSGTVVQLFANGTIVIQHPGLLTMNTPTASVLVQSLADAVEGSIDAPGRDVDE